MARSHRRLGITITTPARQEFYDITAQVLDLVAETGVSEGVVMAYTQHTSCCVFIQEESEDVTYYGMQLILRWSSAAPALTARSRLR